MTRQERTIQIKDAINALIEKDSEIKAAMIANKLNDKKILTVTGTEWTDQNVHHFCKSHRIKVQKINDDESYYRGKYIKELKNRIMKSELVGEIKARAKRTIYNLESQGL